MSAYYHLSVSVISRSTGRSAVACSAYRSGKFLRDERYGMAYDYSPRRGIAACGIVVTENAPEWASNRETLWNHVEAYEKRKDAQLAREFIVAIPHQLSPDHRQELVENFIRSELTPRGIVADWAIHAPNRKGDERNWHAHIMTTMRPLSKEGFDKIKDRSLNSRAQLTDWREAWADAQNNMFRKLNLRDLQGNLLSVDHRSFEDMGIELEPTVHLGVHATAMERKGMQTELGDLNREITNRNLNAALEQMRIAKLAEEQEARNRTPGYQM